MGEHEVAAEVAVAIAAAASRARREAEVASRLQAAGDAIGALQDLLVGPSRSLARTCGGTQDGRGRGRRANVERQPLRYLGVLVVLGICRGNDHPLCSHEGAQGVDRETRVYAMSTFTASSRTACTSAATRTRDDSNDDPGHGEARTRPPPSPARWWQLSFPAGAPPSRCSKGCGTRRVCSRASEGPAARPRPLSRW